MKRSLGQALLVMLAAVLTACSNGGGAVAPPSALVPPAGNSPSGSSFVSSNVKIQEISIPYPWTSNWQLANGDTSALSVSPTGTVYFGEGGGNAGTLLYSYFAGKFAQTEPAYNWCSQDVSTCCGTSSQPCTGTGVTAIDAQSADPTAIFWSGETAAEGVPDGLIFMGGDGVKAAAPPAPYNAMMPTNATFFLSLVTDESGTLWDSGGGGYGAFGYPANVSSLPCSSGGSTNCWDALWLANGPNHHVWGFMHVESSSSRFGWPILPSQTTGSIILEFDSTGQVLHSYNVAGFIGGIAEGGDGALWFTNQTANTVERISGSGSITQYAIPTADSGAAAITGAADGALWFVESNANKVGRVDSAGRFSEFTLPTANSGPMAIGADPAGGACSPSVIWVLEVNSGKLAELTY